MQYLAKAKTDTCVVAAAADVDCSAEGSMDVPVTAYDTEGTKVFSAVLRMNVKH